MENVGGTEVISRAREVLFVAGPPLARAVALQLALLPTRGGGEPFSFSHQTEGLRTCALHAQAGSPSTAL